ncbi:SEFIR domain-containing protein [Desulfolutivibrio sulfoxidireducens]|uniref:SEFIR domain-containing protein n=1 Tax=Desulfolutivibrio sulfoxidireducens TaxID=2773299 RepID=UPI00159D51C6|nr:SEFIR domain-containing protein [Desulfolutivibrio sulfoxidireducens]QLA17654.1 hypothetical protein GD605_17005 [Desulfolutivibrio sulfoxidireducens]
MVTPNLFISYSWSSPEHVQKVVELATELCGSGVNVMLDKWALKEGHDTVSFMERMVNDPEIKKVVMICDEQYAKKADGRSGGVGTETQIISKEIYDNQQQDKFVAIVFDTDENGKPYLPLYYKSRIYIDLSDPGKFSENYERLLRWIFDKPFYVKPEIGSMPSFLAEGTHVSLGTTIIAKRCIEAVKNDRSIYIGLYREYCDTLAVNLEKFRIASIDGQDELFDEAVVKSIEEFLPFRNEFIQLFFAITQYASTDKHIIITHTLIEQLLPYTKRPGHITRYKVWDFDNLSFIGFIRLERTF